MAIITVTTQVNEKNTRTVNTAKGDKKIISVPLFEKEKGSNVKVAYGSAFLPDFIQLGDVVTISGRVQAKESGEYVNYNFVFPTVEKVFISNDSQAQAKQDLFGGSEPIEVNESELPFQKVGYMYTAEEREQIIDIVDKMSLLKQDFDGAFTWIKENVSMPFDFDGEQQFISDLKQLVKINALKFGKIYEGVLN